MNAQGEERECLGRDSIAVVYRRTYVDSNFVFWRHADSKSNRFGCWYDGSVSATPLALLAALYLEK